MKGAADPRRDRQAPHRDRHPGGGAWAPLRESKLFRYLWIAQSVSVLGTWMQTVGSQWYLVDQSAVLVALVQTALTLPYLLFALPAGALGDRGHRRILILGSLGTQTVVAGVMAALAAADRLPGGTLLALTFVLGSCAAIGAPAIQSLQSDSVPRHQLAQAATLTSLSVNVGRAVGPGVGGALVALSGPAVVFALNAATFAFALLLLGRQAMPRVSSGRGQRIAAAMLDGTRYTFRNPQVRRVIVWTLVFAPLSAAIWALLPTIAYHDLGLSVSGYGLLLGAVGLGSVGSVFLLPYLRRAVPQNLSTGVALSVMGIALVLVGSIPRIALAAIVLVPTGLAYITILARLSSDMQLSLPPWVRARGLAIYQVCFSTAVAVGSAVWGALASGFSAGLALALAGVLLVVAGPVLHWVPMHDAGSIVHEPVGASLAGSLPGGVPVGLPSPDSRTLRV